MLIDGEKWACDACVRGHRVSNCQHSGMQSFTCLTISTGRGSAMIVSSLAEPPVSSCPFIADETSQTGLCNTSTKRVDPCRSATTVEDCASPGRPTSSVTVASRPTVWHTAPTRTRAMLARVSHPIPGLIPERLC